MVYWLGLLGNVIVMILVITGFGLWKVKSATVASSAAALHQWNECEIQSWQYLKRLFIIKHF